LQNGKMANLKKYPDRSIWISDDRISALISDSCGGIGQIDFHGAQPVSRNAKMLHDADGVLKFTLICGATKIPLAWDKLSVFPAGVRSRMSTQSRQIWLEIGVHQNTLQARCRISAPEIRDEPLQFRVHWNPASQTTEVHGQRRWQLTEMDSHTLRLQATDQIILKEWLRRPGDYQGDFLIPEGWRRIIFQNRKISGTGRLADLPICTRLTWICRSNCTTPTPGLKSVVRILFLKRRLTAGSLFRPGRSSPRKNSGNRRFLPSPSTRNPATPRDRTSKNNAAATGNWRRPFPRCTCPDFRQSNAFSRKRHKLSLQPG
jgi:hypothetical protein